MESEIKWEMMQEEKEEFLMSWKEWMNFIDRGYRAGLGPLMNGYLFAALACMRTPAGESFVQFLSSEVERSVAW